VYRYRHGHGFFDCQRMKARCDSGTRYNLLAEGVVRLAGGTPWFCPSPLMLSSRPPSSCRGSMAQAGSGSSVLFDQHHDCVFQAYTCSMGQRCSSEPPVSLLADTSCKQPCLCAITTSRLLLSCCSAQGPICVPSTTTGHSKQAIHAHHTFYVPNEVETLIFG
jgi:hypothetical protein